MWTEIKNIFYYPVDNLECLVNFIENVNNLNFCFQHEILEKYDFIYPASTFKEISLQDTKFDLEQLTYFDTKQNSWRKGWTESKRHMINNNYWRYETEQSINLQNKFLNFEFHGSGLAELTCFVWNSFFDDLAYRRFVRNYLKEIAEFFGAKQILHCAENLGAHCSIDNYRWGIEAKFFGQGKSLINSVTFEGILIYLESQAEIPSLNFFESYPIDYEDQREYNRNYSGYFIVDY